MMEEAEMRRAIEVSKAMQSNAMVQMGGKEEITLVETSGKEEGEITLVEGEQDVVNTRPLVLCSPRDVMDISDDSEEEYLLKLPRVVLFINSKVL